MKFPRLSSVVINIRFEFFFFCKLVKNALTFLYEVYRFSAKIVLIINILGLMLVGHKIHYLNLKI